MANEHREMPHCKACLILSSTFAQIEMQVKMTGRLCRWPAIDVWESLRPSNIFRLVFILDAECFVQPVGRLLLAILGHSRDELQ